MNKKNKLEKLGIKFKPLNIKELKIILPSVNYDIVSENKIINSVIYEYEPISLGDKYTVDVSNYQIDYKVNNISISSKYPKEILLIETSKNNYNTTTLFLLPLIFANKSISSYVDDNRGYLINSFLDCSFIDKKNKYTIFLLVKFTKSELFKMTEEAFENHENFVKKIDYENYVIYEFECPDKFKSDFDLIISGKYSKINKLAKNKIIDFHGKTIDGSVIYSIVNRDEGYKKQLEDFFDMDLTNEELWKKIDGEDVLTKNLL